MFDGDPQLYYNLGLTYTMYSNVLNHPHRKEQYYLAVVMFEWCSKLDPHHPYATNNLAYVCILLKKYQEAIEACNDAYSVNRGANNYLRNWAIALLNHKKPGDAVEVIKRAIDAEPGCASICGCIDIL